MKCDVALPLVPRYLDGELTEEDAGPLRGHLLACPSCRTAVQEDTALRAWFVATPEVAVPADFAAHVTRRAFAGDRGAVPTAARPRTESADRGREDTGRLLQFTVQAVAIAAAVLIVLSIAIRRLELPSGADLKADDASKEQAIEALEALNRAEAAREVEDEDEQR